MSNNPPDIILELSNRQATFMLENCDANIRLALAMIISIADDKISVKEKQQKAEKFIKLSDKFREIRLALLKAGEKELEN